MQITVTQEDIEKGRQRSALSCPIALAATRAFKVPVTVGYSVLLIGNVWRGDSRLLPEAAFDFRRNFDLGYAVQPFTFEVPDAPHH